jgi:predicted dehydrogenase
MIPRHIMRFALLGDHADGLDMARALAASGRHELGLYCGPPTGLQQLQRHALTPRPVNDLEELLVDAHLDAVIVAGSMNVRAAQLRRALQAECHVLSVHPADVSPDIAYEAAMLQADTGRVLLPLLPMTLHPGIRRLKDLSLSPRLVELEIWSTEEVLLEGQKPGVPGWDVLRYLGGEIAELFVLAGGTELAGGQPASASGRFLNGSLFQATYLPNQAESRWRLAFVTPTGRAVIRFEHGWPGPAQLTYADGAGAEQTVTWEAIDPWAALVERFEQAVEAAARKKTAPGKVAEESLTRASPLLGWQDELRALELDAAARRSAEKGRSSTLDLQESTEDASFKGAMTMVGCSLIWAALGVLIVSVWFPWLVWLILPVFGIFLVMQALRWVVRE